MAGSTARRTNDEPPEFRNTALSDALQTQDIAAVAFALRHGPTVVPLHQPAGGDDPLDAGEVWTYRDPSTGEIALLLFSDAAHKPATLPPGVALNSPGWLRAFLGAHEDDDHDGVLRHRRPAPDAGDADRPHRRARRLSGYAGTEVLDLAPRTLAHSPDGVPHGGPRLCRRTRDPDRPRHEGQPRPPNPPRPLSAHRSELRDVVARPPRERVRTSPSAPRDGARAVVDHVGVAEPGGLAAPLRRTASPAAPRRRGSARRSRRASSASPRCAPRRRRRSRSRGRRRAR